MQERRQFVRQKVEKLAYLVVEPNRYSVTLTEVSERGARLRVEQSWELPGAFAVYVPSDRLVARGLMVWRHGREIGVQFQEALQPVSEHPDPALRSLAEIHDFGRGIRRPGTPGMEPLVVDA